MSYLGYISAKCLKNIQYLTILFEGTLTWTTLYTSGPSPSPRRGHGMVVVGKTIYVHGGWKSEFGVLSDFWCLDFSAFSSIPRISMTINEETNSYPYCIQTLEEPKNPGGKISPQL